MVSIAGYSLIAFIAGIVGTLLVLRIMKGGKPEFPAGGEAKCENGEILFQIDPKANEGFHCVAIKSLINGAGETDHVPIDVGTWHRRPSPPAGGSVTLTVKCYYAFDIGHDFEPAEMTVPTCDPSSSSSSSSEESSSSSSSEESSSSSSSEESSSSSSSEESSSSSSSEESSSSSSSEEISSSSSSEESSSSSSA